MNHVLKLSVVIFFLAACKGTADNKVPELANEMCGCFDGFEKELSEKAKKLMKEVSVAEKPQEALMKGIQAMEPGEAKAFAEQLKQIGDKNSAIMKCLNEFDKKHAAETTADKKALTQKLLTELQKNTNCYVGAAVVNMNPK